MVNAAKRLHRLLLILLLAAAFCRAQHTNLPDAPTPNADVLSELSSGALLVHSGSMAAGEGQRTFPPTGSRRYRLPELESGWLPVPRPCVSEYCAAGAPLRACCEESSSAFDTYLAQNTVHIFTSRELAAMGARGVIDPFNLLTIVGTSAVSVAADSHSPYGPGAMGIAKLSGITLTEDMTNAFFETFLIPSIDHQDPRYHRMPNASLTRRLAHCIYQPFWTVSDTGKGMVNYSNLVGAVADEAVLVTYVPYQETGLGASAARVGVNLATTPIGNMVTEFVPDLARHININVVFIQRIINRVAIEGALQPTGPIP